MDDDGIRTGTHIRVAVKVIVRGDQMTVDLSGVGAEEAGFYNSGGPAGRSAARLHFQGARARLSRARHGRPPRRYRAAGAINDGDTHNTPIEAGEAKGPLVARRRCLRQDSGGPGRWRGGLGELLETEVLVPAMALGAIERTICAPWGLFGGKDALPNKVWYGARMHPSSTSSRARSTLRGSKPETRV